MTLQSWYFGTPDKLSDVPHMIRDSGACDFLLY
jgi:hypothetical protein